MVFAVWEPILPIDWSPPGTSALRRLADRRVRQYWDPEHLVATLIKNAEASGKLHPECCEQNGFLWDLAAAYGPGAKWEAGLPEPIFLNGPVVDNESSISAVLEQTTKARN